MSLIPSESYSFPDLSEGATPKKRKPQAPPPEPVIQSEPEPVLPPAPEPENAFNADAFLETPPPAIHPNVEKPVTPRVAPIARPKPIARSAPIAPEDPLPPIIPTAPMPKPVRPVRPIRPSQRARPTGPAPVQPMRPPRPTTRPVKRVVPVMPVMPVMPIVPDELDRPAVYYDEPEVEPEEIEESDEEIRDFQFPNWEEEPRHSRRHRRNKVLKFIFLEGLALALLIVSTKLEVADQFSENSLTLVYKMLMLLAAIAMAVIPVVFFALPPRLPPSRR